MYYHIDSEYRIIFDKESIMLVPEYKAIVTDTKYGWDFVYYVFYFCSPSPFGNFPEEERDIQVSNIIGIGHGMESHTNSNTLGFYKHKKFKKASELFDMLFPNPIMQSYRSYVNDNTKLLKLKEGINLSSEDDIPRFAMYIDLIAKVKKQIMEMDKDLKETVTSKRQVGLGTMLKDDE